MTDRNLRMTKAAAALLPALLVLAPSGAVASPASASDTTTITLLATNDFHRQLAPLARTDGADPVGGAAWLAAHLDAARDRAPDALHVDAGDLTGAGSSGVAGVVGGYADEATVDVMDQMGLEVTTVGNHEFDLGVDELLRVRQGGCYVGDCSYRGDQPWGGASFDTLAANVTVDATGATLLPSWTIRETNGVEVGFVGVTETSLVAAAGNEAVTLTDPFAAAQPAIAEVRAAGADVVVLLWHNGSKQAPAGDYDINGCEGITGPSTWIAPWVDADVIVDGHTHHPYVCDFSGGMPLMTQAADRGTMYTEITLTYDRVSGGVVDRDAVNRPVTHDRAPDPVVAALVEAYGSGLTAPAAEPTEPELAEPTAPESTESGSHKGGKPTKEPKSTGPAHRSKR